MRSAVAPPVPASSSPAPGNGEVVEAIVGGHLRVRLEGAGEPGAQVVRAALAGLPKPAGRPDLVLRIGGAVRPGGQVLRPLPGGIDAGGLWVADHLGRGARLPLFSETPVAAADRAIDAGFVYVWVFLPLVRALLWRRGRVMVHAAGAAIDGRAVAVAGWEGAGKSVAVLEALSQGADLVGDDWLAMGPDGTVAAVSALLNLHAAHLSSPHARRWRRPSIRLAGLAARGARKGAQGLRGARPVSVGLAQLAEAFRRASKVKANVAQVFPGAAVVSRAPLAALALLVPEGGTSLAAVEQVATALSACSAVEWRHCADLEALAAFAWPERARTVFPSAAQEAAVVRRALADVRLVVLSDPLPRDQRGALVDLLARSSGPRSAASSPAVPGAGKQNGLMGVLH